jgi:hypothetical protein
VSLGSGPSFYWVYSTNPCGQVSLELDPLLLQIGFRHPTPQDTLVKVQVKEKLLAVNMQVAVLEMP